LPLAKGGKKSLQKQESENAVFLAKSAALAKKSGKKRGSLEKSSIIWEKGSSIVWQGKDQTKASGAKDTRGRVLADREVLEDYDKAEWARWKRMYGRKDINGKRMGKKEALVPERFRTRRWLNGKVYLPSLFYGWASSAGKKRAGTLVLWKGGGTERTGSLSQDNCERLPDLQKGGAATQSTRPEKPKEE